MQRAARRQANISVQELVFALAVVAVVAVLVVPVPATVLDILLAGNLALSVLLLVGVLRASEPMSFSVFPSLLLLTTLLRIALNISTTRRILSTGDAGTVVKAFGNAVVQGNYAVGLVMMILLTVVQLLVVSKGAERVAEVAARFSLDALPGRQLAIDADAKAGTIRPEEAKAARSALIRESQFHGSMDGAMKFVRGDALAGIILVFTNLVAGIAIGVIQRGLPFDLAIRKYAPLAVGDGLVTQVPSLTMATAAALLATRIASTDGSSLAREASSQMLASITPLLVAAGAAFTLSAAPGMPAIPFLTVGTSLLLVALFAKRSRVQSRTIEQITQGPFHLVSHGQNRAAFGKSVAAVFNHYFDEIGIIHRCTVGMGSEKGDSGAELFLHGELLSRVVSADDARGYGILKLRPHVANLLGLDDVKTMLDTLEKQHPVLVQQVVPSVITLPVLWATMRDLLSNGASIQSLKDILEIAARSVGQYRDPADLALIIRDSTPIARTLYLTEGHPQLRVVELHPLLQESLRPYLNSAQSLATGGSSSPLNGSIPASLVADILHAAKPIVTEQQHRTGRCILFTLPEFRKILSVLLRPLGVVEVISATELLPDTRIETIATVRPLTRLRMTDLSSLAKSLDAIPRLGWITEPSPITEIPNLAHQLGLDGFYVKRDDQISALCGGTKPRKLDYLLAMPLFRDAPAWAAAGAITSGNLVALTSAAKELKKHLHAYMFYTPLSPSGQDNLAYVASGPTTIHYYRNRVNMGLLAPGVLIAESTGGVPVIPPGATSGRATVGTVLAGVELAKQIESKLLPEPDQVYVSFGSGGSAVGLAIGLALSEIRSEVVAVCSVEHIFSTQGRLESLISDALKDLQSFGITLSRQSIRISLDHNAVGKGYGIPSEDSLAACEMIARHGVKLEPVYTGKTLGQLVKNIKDKKPKNILFWSTVRREHIDVDTDWQTKLPATLKADLANGPKSSTRRKILLGAVATAAVAGVYRTSGYPSLPWKGRVLSAWHAHVLWAAAEVFLVVTDAEKKAVEQLPMAIDSYLLTMPDSAKQEIEGLFVLIEHGPLMKKYIHRFTVMTPAERLAYLNELESTHPLLSVAVRGLRDLVMLGFYQHPSTWPSLAYKGPMVSLDYDPHGPGRMPWPAYDSLRAPIGKLPPGVTS